MGEYFMVCNFDKREVLNPEVFGQLHKLGDFVEGLSRRGILHGLLYLLALSGTNKEIELRERDHLFGRWAGDRIALMGEYYSETIASIPWSQEIHSRISNGQDGWVDISEHVVRAIGGEPDLEETGPRSQLRADGTAISLLPSWQEDKT